MADLNCPNCGYGLAPRFSAAKMTTCPSCATTLFLDGSHMETLGSSGDMHEAPMLFEIGQTVQSDRLVCDIVGHARFDYGPGWWDEFFAIKRDGAEVWISVDEGDVILQEWVPMDKAPDLKKPPRLGAVLTAFGAPFRVTEHSSAACIAVRGEFPELLHVGLEYSYVNCQGDDGLMLSGEFSTGDPDWYIGQWLDPFALRVSGAA